MSGWYLPEADSSGFYRWTGPEAVSTIDLNAAVSERHLIRIHVVHGVDESTFASLRLFINSHPVNAALELTDCGSIISCEVPPEAVSDGAVRIRIDLGKPTRLQTGQDTRHLGIAVRWIDFVPITNDHLEGTSGQRPLLSVVIPSVAKWADVQDNVGATVTQAKEFGAEIVLTNGEANPSWPMELRESVRFISRPGADIFELRALAIEAASGSIVAVTEDHCVPCPNWCADLVSTFARYPHSVAIGGRVTNGSSTRLIDRANFAATFAQYWMERPSAPAPSIANMAVRRDFLPESIPPGWVELTFLSSLSKIPGAIGMSGLLETSHIQSQGVVQTLAAHFNNGRACRAIAGPCHPSWYKAITEGIDSARRTPALAPCQEISTVSLMTLWLLVKMLIISHAVGLMIGSRCGKGRSAHHLG